jgi:chromosome segregation ATPase
MARYKSRAKRCGEATSQLSDASSKLDEIASEIEGLEDDAKPTTDQQAAWAKTLGAAEDEWNLGTSEIESLAEEMRQWEENIQEKFSQTSKYETISGSAETLENARDELQGIEWPTLPDADGDREAWDTFGEALAEVSSALGDQESEAGNAEFPGMYG